MKKLEIIGSLIMIRVFIVYPHESFFDVWFYVQMIIGLIFILFPEIKNEK